MGGPLTLGRAVTFSAYAPPGYTSKEVMPLGPKARKGFELVYRPNFGR